MRLSTRERIEFNSGGQPESNRFAAFLLCLAFLLGGCNSVGITKTTPTITWPAPAAITYGTALSATQLDATASVTGTFAYTPPAATVLTAGTQTLSVTFTPTDSNKYTTATNTASLTVNKATPTINWPAPAAITFGTALSATQLDATASVPGTFVYTPPAATVLSAGTQNLSVVFTPTDSTNYTTANFSVSITVNAAVGGGIGPAGGVVNGFYGASVTIPAGALATTVDIEIPRDSTGSPAVPSTGIDAAGAMYALTPHGTAFSAPATVQIPFDSTRIPTDATPVIYKGEPGGAFTAIPTTVNGDFLSADVSNFSWVLPGYAATLPRMVYALTRADVNGTSTVSVSSFKITKGTGALAPTSSAPVGTGAISVTVHPSRRFLYVVNGSRLAQGAATNVPANSISVYRLDSTTGNISGPTDTKPVNGNPVSVVVHPTGKFIYVVNEVRFGTSIGNVSAFSIDNATGALTSQGTVADLNGAPATALAFAPSGEFAYVTYLPGGPQNPGDFDTVKTYGVSPTSGRFTTTPIGSAPTGDNPWALVVTPGGHFAYVASLSAQGNVDQIAVYTINQTTGLLTVQSSFGISPATGQSPLSLAMDPEARFLYVGLQSLVFAPPNSNFNVHTYNHQSHQRLAQFRRRLGHQQQSARPHFRSRRTAGRVPLRDGRQQPIGCIQDRRQRRTNAAGQSDHKHLSRRQFWWRRRSLLLRGQWHQPGMAGQLYGHRQWSLYFRWVPHIIFEYGSRQHRHWRDRNRQSATAGRDVHPGCKHRCYRRLYREFPAGHQPRRPQRTEFRAARISQRDYSLSHRSTAR